jgi:hypothetical protein
LMVSMLEVFAANVILNQTRDIDHRACRFAVKFEHCVALYADCHVVLSDSSQ